MSLSPLFERLAVVQVLLSIAAFCIATDNPGLLLLAGTVGVASWYLTRGPRGRTLPTGWLNTGAALATLWMVWEVRGDRVNLLVAMGHFTLLLQLLLLYARKTAREYAHLLVISVLQLIGASVLSVSMSYAVLLLAYCTVGIATLLLFHLRTVDERVEAEHAAAGARWGIGAMGGPAPKPRFNHTAGRGARRALRRVGLSALAVTAVVTLGVFVALPRSGATRVNAAFDTGVRPASSRSTGFSPEVRLGNGPLGSGSQEPVLHLRVGDQAMNQGSADMAWLVRGMALDDYDPTTFRWRRSLLSNRAVQIVPPHGLIHPPARGRRRGHTAEITVRRGGPAVVFGVVTSPTVVGGAGFRPTTFSGSGLPPVIYNTLDQQLSCNSAVPAGASYRLEWPRTTPLFNRPATESRPPVNPPGVVAWARSRTHAGFSPTHDGRRSNPYRDRRLASVTPETYARVWEPRADQVRRTALQVVRAAGLRRDPAARHGTDDARVAAALSRHLSTQYTYSLENPPPPPGRDPVVRFLFETRRGHCELFAAGLVALCRSVGIPARMVVGFRASEYSELGGYYVVRQSHAHAWTEVDAGPGIGWITLDATPASPVAAQHAAAGGLRAATARVWEYLEFNWIRQVVGFDERTHTAALNLVRRVGTFIKALSADAARPLNARLSAAARGFNPAAFAAAAVSAGIGTLLIALASRKRGRARRTPPAPPGHPAPPVFYHRVRALLECGGLQRPGGQTPRDFARAVGDDHPALRETLPALTETYYAVRFGGQTLDESGRRRVEAQLAEIERALMPPGGAATPPA